ncbi:MAG TPA: S41 family peptidase [Pyrinomonadaceae bacterium]|nr:S41 family peptidase [Pyrinomonadaceae bacterium]
MTKFLLTAFALLIFSPPAARAQEPAPNEARAAVVVAGGGTRERIRRDTFDLVWRTVNDNHYDPTFGGLDWPQVRARYEPLALSAGTDAEFYDVLRRMVGELKLSHFAIYPPGAFEPPAAGENRPAAAVRGAAGLDVRFIGNQVVVSRVEPGSAAERAGLRTGFVLTKVGERDLARAGAASAPNGSRPAAAPDAADASETTEAYRQTLLRARVLSLLGGAAGETRHVSYLDGRGRPRQAVLTLLESDEGMSEPFGNFPAMPTQFEARRIGEVGYVRFNIWVASLMPKLREAVVELRDARALVFDLRGNPGGLGVMGIGLAGMLSDEEILLGTMRQRRGHTNFLVNPQPDPFAGPVVVLLDRLSGSTSEIFALGLQEAGRAVVVGERSAGAALPSIFARLPSGATFQFAFADFRTPKGVAVEGRGVVPDVVVSLDRRSLLAGRDPQLEAALEVARRRAAPRAARPAARK